MFQQSANGLYCLDKSNLKTLNFFLKKELKDTAYDNESLLNLLNVDIKQLGDNL